MTQLSCVGFLCRICLWYTMQYFWCNKTYRCCWIFLLKVYCFFKLLLVVSGFFKLFCIPFSISDLLILKTTFRIWQIRTLLPLLLLTSRMYQMWTFFHLYECKKTCELHVLEECCACIEFNPLKSMCIYALHNIYEHKSLICIIHPYKQNSTSNSHSKIFTNNGSKLKPQTLS